MNDNRIDKVLAEQQNGRKSLQTIIHELMLFNTKLNLDKDETPLGVSVLSTGPVHVRMNLSREPKIFTSVGDAVEFIDQWIKNNTK